MRTGCDYWDQEVAEKSHQDWMSKLDVRLYINTMISGRPGGWPFDWLQETFPGRRFPRALSVGCGSGPLERDLIRRNLCDRVDAFDGSVHSLYRARSEAIGEGMADRIRYFAWNFNEPNLPRETYDAVFFHQSLHHVAKIEKLLRAVLRSLKPGGIVYLDEMIGPSRTYWNDRTVEPYRRIYRTIPREYRYLDEFPYPVQYSDPSEAIRSGEILDQLRIGFRITHFRGYAGNLLGVIYPALIMDRIPDRFLRELIELEKQMIAEGQQHFHAVMIAQPRSEGSRTVATLRYFLEPKLKRIGREAAKLLRRGGPPR
jgi:SAM-dependent methyltransferase